MKIKFKVIEIGKWSSMIPNEVFTGAHLPYNFGVFLSYM